MRYYLLLFFTVTFVFSSFSQTEERLSQLPFDAIRDSINKYKFSERSKAIDAAEAYILRGKREKDKTEEWLGMESIALIYVRFRMYKEANEHAEKTLEFAKNNNLPKLEMRSLSLLGDLQQAVTTVDKQLFYYNKLLQLAEAHNDEAYRETALNKIAAVQDLSGNTGKAIDTYKKSLVHYQNKPLDSNFNQIEKNSSIVSIYNSLAISHLKLKQLDSAKLYSAYIKKFKEKELDTCYAVYRDTINAEIAYEEKRFKDARQNYEKAYAVCPSEYDLMQLNKAYALGKIEVGAKNYHEAIRILQKGLDDYRVTAVEEGFMQDYYEKLAEAYKYTGNFERASYYFEKYLSTQAEFNKLKEDARESFIKKERATFKKDFDALVSEKEENQSNLNYLLLGGSIIILGLLFLLLKFYRNKKADELKFETLLAKIEAAQSPGGIIDTKDEELEEKNISEVPEETKQQILEGLKKLEEKEYFLRQDCNSYNVARKIGTNTSYLSKVINNHYGKNFNTYINDLRINYAITRLKNDAIFRSYSIQSIAEEVGYKSADSFTKYFKKDTGLNPSF
ncbi:helix-turn-helix domain-containing protein [Salegentibacter salegens]|uniref:Helix-turn-helix domain-containing protein n=1 Tax=Salegentibacter salegens TaxID=143223 RepID=A0A1M7ML71_9FLAO|nr:helix-turn-helix domain-containing protein [Salegentibacter salegens]PRX38628.1 helix-turn-helix protein [Salegentibacter salegens]SHM91614.1 Helix-turn-helix domain-containing protein [Salegentibacter salegens]